MRILLHTIPKLPSRLLCTQGPWKYFALGTRCYSSNNETLAPEGPLTGIRILDLTRVLAGPFCTQILADYGADVIKIENPRGGDDTRLWRDANERDLWKADAKQTSLYFNTINRNKRSVAVDLKNAQGRDIILNLARNADVVVENFKPGKLDKLGLGYNALKAVNSSIILASISGYGADGPYAQRAGYDVIAAAEAGLLHVTGEPDGPPTKPGVGLMDMCTGLYLHGAIASALVARERTGLGQKIDTSLFETTISILSNVAMSWLNTKTEAQRWGTGHPTIVPYEAFKTKDSYFVVGAVNNRQFKTLCEYIGAVTLCDDPRFSTNSHRVANRRKLKVIIQEIIGARTTKEWEKTFDGSGMPYGPINDLERVFQHPQIAARHMVETLPSKQAVSGSISVLGIPVKFSVSKPSVRDEPPSLGQHTEIVLKELGLSAEHISKLRSEGTIGS